MRTVLSLPALLSRLTRFNSSITWLPADGRLSLIFSSIIICYKSSNENLSPLELFGFTCVTLFWSDYYAAYLPSTGRCSV